MPGCLQLAAEEPEGLLNIGDRQIEELVCRALRGESAVWPTAATQLDRQGFLEYCRRHGVAGLVCQRMQGQVEWAGWPLEVREGLGRSNKAGVAQELMRGHYLSIVLREFSVRGIRCLLLKGEALAATHYEAPGTRARSDCDLFVGLQDIEQAKDALLDCGFQVVSPVYKSHQFSAVRADDTSGAVQLDVHWRVSNHPRYARCIPFEDAYRNSIALPGPAAARAMDPVDTLLVACLHRLGNDRHDANRLIWLYDIHVLAASMSMGELEQAATRATARNLQAALLDGLLRARERFATRLPAHLLDNLAQPAGKESVGVRLASSNMGLLVDDLRVLPGLRSRLNLLRELFLPSADALLRRSGKTSPLWLPLLYAQQVLGGVAKRLSLR